MSLMASGHGVLAGVGVAVVAGVGLVGTAVAGLGVGAASGPAASGSSALRQAPCVGEALPTLGGGQGNVVGAGGPDLLAGTATDVTGLSWPVLWRHGDVTRLVTGLDPASTADVNGAGVVVGSGYDAGKDTSVAWAWVAGTTYVLPAPPGASATAEAVDQSGQIVGSVELGEDEQAAIWPDYLSAPRLLDPLPGDQGSHAFAIAPDGTVGGVSLGDGGTPVVWHGGGAAQALGPTSSDGLVLGFDAGSHPTGTTYSADGRGRATVWTRNSSATRLPVPRAAGNDAVVGGTGGVRVGTTGGPESGTRPMGTLWGAGSSPGVLAAVDGPGFRGVASSAADVTSDAGTPMVVGYSADAVGRRLPTVWRCR